MTERSRGCRFDRSARPIIVQWHAAFSRATVRGGGEMPRSSSERRNSLLQPKRYVRLELETIHVSRQQLAAQFAVFDSKHEQAKGQCS